MANTDRTPICPYADTAENLALRNDILLQGQIVYNLTNNTYKVGDGESRWTEITTEYKYGENGTIIEDGGSNDFIVNFTIIDESMNCITDKTFAEIQTAIQEGCNIYGTIEIIQDDIPVTVKLPLTISKDDEVLFTGIHFEQSLSLAIVDGGECGVTIRSLVSIDSIDEVNGKIGDLNALNVENEENKENLVKAINELKTYAEIIELAAGDAGVMAMERAMKDLSNVENDVFKTKAEDAGISGSVDLSGCEKLSNKNTEINVDSTNEQYPTAKATYDFVNNQIKPLEDCFETIVSQNILPTTTEAGYYDNSLNRLNSDRYVRTPESVTLDTTQKNIYVYSKTKLTNEKDTLTISYIKEDGSYLSKHIFSSAINDAVKFNIPVGAVSFVAHIQNYTYSGLTMDDFCISYYPSENGYVPYGEIKRVLNKAEDKIFYVSEDGNDDNDGLSIDSPFATIQKALNLDAHNIAIKRGTYFINNVLEFKDKNNIHIYAYDNNETYSNAYPRREKVNLVGGIYYSNYVKNEDGIYVCEGLTANRVTLIDNEDTKATILLSVSNYEDVKATDNSFYSDGTNLYFNTSNKTFEKIAIPKYNYILTFDNCNNVLVEDIACNVAIKGVITLNNCSGVTFNNCEANYSQADRGFALTNTNAIFNNCIAYRNCVDGFSYHGYGTTIMNECISKWNSDDGCSHHYGCIGTINGGRFTGNGKCGITPAYGANVSIYNAICDQNDTGGIGYLSTDNGHALTKGVVNGCLMMNNTGYGFRTNSLCEVIMLNCKFKDNSLGNIDNQGTLINLDIVE